VFGDHFHFIDSKAVIRSAGTRRGTRFEPDEGYVLAQKRLEINAAGSDLEIAAGVVFGQCVITIRAPRQPLTLVGTVLLVAVGVCANPSATSRAGTTINRHALFILALWRSEISLGIWFCFPFSRRTLARFGLQLKNLGHPGETPQP
jgi:hypothetical protein